MAISAMSGRETGLHGKVAFITGIARGQGRAHALALAQAGADIIGIDRAADVASMGYPMGTEAELAETVSRTARTASGDDSEAAGAPRGLTMWKERWTSGS